jgi:hypothetical protein
MVFGVAFLSGLRGLLVVTFEVFGGIVAGIALGVACEAWRTRARG